MSGEATELRKLDGRYVAHQESSGVPEGQVPPDWSLVPLGALCSFTNGVNAERGAYGSGVPFANVLEVITHTHLRAADIPGRVNLRKSEIDAFSVRRGDVLFNRTSETQEEVGLSAVYDDDEIIVFGGFVIRGRLVDASMDPTYVGYGLRALSVRAQIVAQGQGAIRANIGQGNLSRVLVPVPPLAEQRAIAEALSDVDALLGALEALIAKKRAIKRAAMQQLLTGKTRRPGFSGEWKTKRLGEVLKFQVGFPFSSQFFTAEQSGLRLIKNRDLKAADEVVYYTGPYAEEYLIADGDVLVGMDGDFRPCIWQWGKALLNQRVGRLRASSDRKSVV